MLLSAESRSTKRVQFRLMADSDLGKTGAQKDDGGRTGGGREGGREGGDNPPCPRFNSFSTSRVPFLPFRTTCRLPPSPRFPRRVSRVPFIPHNVLHDRASEGNAPHRTHMAGLLSFTSVVRPRPGPSPFSFSRYCPFVGWKVKRPEAKGRKIPPTTLSTIRLHSQ